MRRVTGIQMHHSRVYPLAAACSTNMQQYLKSAAEATIIEAEAVECLEMAAALREFNRRIWRIEQESRARFRTFQMVQPEAFKDCVAGLRPWHDENNDVELRCNCSDQCLHRFGVDPGESGVCNCEGVKRACPVHSEAT